MANQQIKRLWRRRPEVEEAEFELLQSRVRARLLGTDGSTDETPAAEAQADDGDALDAAAADGDRAPDDAAGGLDAGARVVPVEATTYELPDVVVGVMAAPDDPLWDVPASVLWPEAEVEPAAAFEPAEAAEPEAATAILADLEVEPAAIPEPEAAKPRRTRATSKHAQVKAVAKPPVRSRSAATGRSRPAATIRAQAVLAPPATPPADATAPQPDPPIAVSEPAIAPSLSDPVPARPRRPGPPRRSRVAPAGRPHVAVSTPYCPYCALLLDPAPESSRRCPRCRERIVVKRVDGRAIYLTEAAVLVFEAERRRMANAGRWNRERIRWLKAAAAVDAPPERVAKLAFAPLSEQVVAASRALYMTTVDRSFRTAKRERRWVDASRIKREQALVLSRMAGSPIPPPEDAVLAHREAAAASLHGVAEMSREAELVSRRCCDVCDADDGQTFRIASELRTLRLPHAGCPRGLCRCDWFLAVRDQSMVRRNLRRRARAEVSASGQGT